MNTLQGGRAYRRLFLYYLAPVRPGPGKMELIEQGKFSFFRAGRGTHPGYSAGTSYGSESSLKWRSL